jgi:SWI/SNF-related matrix-associated actin-dependent regulator 1 of chromatin subfamily A
VRRALPNRTVQVLSGTKPQPIAPADVTIIGDAVIAAWALPLKKGEPNGPLAAHPWAALVVDEAHRMKGLADHNPAKRARAAALISKSMAPEAVRLALTGTPILNRPREIIGALEISGTLHRISPTRSKFLYRFCGPVNNGWGVTYNGASNVAELNALLSSKCMIRRLRSEVLTLPNKGRSTSYAALDRASQRSYRKAQDDLESFLRAHKGDEKYTLNDRAEAIVMLNTLRRLAGEGKVDAVVEMAQDLLAEGEQVFIAAHHVDVVARIVTALASHGVVEIVGGMSADAKQASVDAFQSGRARVLVGNIDAAGVGFTLTAGRHIIVAELPWTPGALQQVEDRLHRIGQTREVISTIVLADIDGGSIDERLWNLLDSKAQVIGAVLDGDDTGLAVNVQQALLDSYR